MLATHRDQIKPDINLNAEHGLRQSQANSPPPSASVRPFRRASEFFDTYDLLVSPEPRRLLSMSSCGCRQRLMARSSRAIWGAR